MKKISVIIPCYNEEKSIGKVIQKIPKSVFEIIVVDNNSKDKSAEIAKNLGAKVVKETKQGYGAALKKGFKEAKGDIFVTLDADGQYPAENILELVDFLEKNNLDFLNCSRFPLKNKKSLNLTRRLGNYFLTLLFNILFGTNIKDSQSGMMIFKKDILKNIKIESDDMPLSEELKIKTILKGYKFAETHIDYYPREGESKLFPLKHGIINSLFLFKIKLQTINLNFLKTISLIFILILIYSYLASRNLNQPFINVTSDVNGENGLAVKNWINGGIFNLKLGKYINGYLHNQNDVSKIKSSDFYTHHPIFYLFPIYITYKIFGISEFSTRLAPFLLFNIGIIFFFLALKKIFNNLLYSFLTTLVFVLLPGVVYYGTTAELAVFSLPAALITFSLFVFYYYSQNKIYFYLFLLSIIFGGLMGWFYFFMPASIWLYLLIEKNKNFQKQKRLLLIVLPLISIFVFALNILHIIVIKDFYGLKDLIESFKYRTQIIPLKFWLIDIYRRLSLNFTNFFLLSSFIGFILFFIKYFKKYFIFLPIIFMPILNTLIFHQWSTHPFGVIFFAPLIAVFSSIFLFYLIENFNNWIFIVIFLLLGSYFSYKNLNHFIEKFLILGKRDIELLKELKPIIKDDDLCLSKNELGLYYGGIVMWYLDKNILMEERSEDCYKAKFVIIFNPQLGDFYNQEFNKFKSLGFKPIGCADLWCLLQKQ